MGLVKADTRSNLFEFNKCTVEILGMKEQDRFAMGASLWFSIPQHTGATCLQLVPCSQNVIDFIANMMNAARRILFKESLDRRVFTERIK